MTIFSPDSERNAMNGNESKNPIQSKSFLIFSSYSIGRRKIRLNERNPRAGYLRHYPSRLNLYPRSVVDAGNGWFEIYRTEGWRRVISRARRANKNSISANVINFRFYG